MEKTPGSRGILEKTPASEQVGLRPSPGGILHVYAHPDDESFGNPATIALYADRGARMDLICLTRGEAGETNGVCAPGELGEVRSAELRAACRALGIDRLQLWDYPDGGLEEMEDEEAVRRLAAAYETLAPEVIVTYADDGITGHLDHLAASRWATEAFFRARRSGGPAPSRLYWRVAPDFRQERYRRPDIVYRGDYTTVIDARAFGHVRAAAERCHVSQRPHTDHASPEFFEMGAVDYYIRKFPEWPGGPKANLLERGPEADLLDGAKADLVKGGPLEADLYGRGVHPEGASFP